MTGRTNNGILVNSANSQLASNVNRIRQNYTYPAWFENTLNWALDGRISEKDLYLAFDNLSKRGDAKLKINRPPPTIVPNPNAPAYIRPTFAHDTDQYGYDYLYGERDFKSDQDIWNKFAQLKTKREEMQTYIDTKIEGLYDTRRSKKEVEQIIIDYYGDDIRRLNEGHASQEKSISGKSGKDHKHKDGNECDCAFWDLPCHVRCQADDAFEGLGKLALIGGIAVVGIFLLKMRLGK